MYYKLFFPLIFASFLLYKQIPQQNNFVTADILNHIYIINGKNLIQYSDEGEIVYQYSSQLLGDITSMDASNPMKILLFYNNFNQVVFLSNKLVPLSSAIELDNMGFTSVSAVCSAARDGFWLFDSKQMQPVYISQNMDIVNKGTHINITDTSSSNIPLMMTEHESKLYICFPELGVWIFDQTGKLLDTIAIPNIQYCQLLSNKLIYLTHKKICMYDLKQKQTINMDIPADDCRYFVFLRQKAVLSNGKSLFFYKSDDHRY